MWTLAYGDHEDRTPTHGYEATREAAMKAFAKSWRRENWRRPAPRACSGCEASRNRKNFPVIYSSPVRFEPLDHVAE
jgi:hypothetical protein